MRWFKTTLLRSSIHAMLSVSTAKPRLPDPVTMDEIREAMLALVDLDRHGGERAAGLARRIRYATELQALWFMRGEIMQLLARTHGEQAAREKVDELSALFGDQLPSGLRSRPSPLNLPYRTSRPHSEET
jgi:hypothetical protein